MKLKTLATLSLLLINIVNAQPQDSLKKTVIKQQKIDFKNLRSVEGAAIYDGKKTDLIQLDDIIANTATNNARQVFSKVPGITVWESDGAGIQLGIGTRGLSPKRSAEFNMRQNGYDISADALGYPESYYSPPMEAIDKVQIVRGAASLQYGTQFGGMVNFISRDAFDNDGLRILSKQTYGAWNLFNSFNQVLWSDSTFGVSAYVQHKQGDDQRKYSSFTQNGANASVGFKTKNSKTTLEFTHMDYLAQQPGGLTDIQFDEDPFQSLRSRNWFEVNWNLLALINEYKPSFNHTFESRLFGLLASRKSLGNLTAPNRSDSGDDRDLLVDDYLNAGWEGRYLYNHSLFNNRAALLNGFRLYKGNLDRQQGFGSDKSDADFSHVTPPEENGSDFNFPSLNASLFGEYMIPLGEYVRITPGYRYEFINTEADGSYAFQQIHPLTGDVINTIDGVDNKSNYRHFPLFGIGLSALLGESVDFYGNFSQNYRAINFNDMRVTNPNLRVDQNLKDEEGFTTDIGFRGTIDNWLQFDVGGFWLEYQDRIGQILQLDSNSFQLYRYRTNLADSRHLGTEGFLEVKWLNLLNIEKDISLNTFFNFTYLRAKYYNSSLAEIEDKQVELVPEIQWRLGLTFKYQDFGTSVLYSYTGDQFTDATNAISTSDGVNGLIPAYGVLDWSNKYKWEYLLVEGGINNLLDNTYFTRRSDGYPGPGIIVSPSRNFYVTLGLDF
jgi:Fe(3+) dicitrate transport protein